jgi:Cu/Ag efflux pump CusA
MDIGFDVTTEACPLVCEPTGGRDIDSVANDIKATLLGMEFPLEYHAELLPDFQDRQASQTNFYALAIFALVGVFLLLQAAAASWRMAFMMFIALPAALTGGLWAASIDGDAVSIGTLVGFLGVFGLAARHFVLFIHRCHDLEDAAADAADAADGAARGDVVRQAAHERLAPILTATITTAVVLLPLLFFGGKAGLEIVHPMSAVMFGGLVTLTAVNLFVVPALYQWFGSRSQASRDDTDLFTDLPVVEPSEATTAAEARQTVDA